MKNDMSGSAIDIRLRRVAQLRRLCLSLARAGRLAGKTSGQPAEKPASVTPGDGESDDGENAAGRGVTARKT